VADAVRLAGVKEEHVVGVRHGLPATDVFDEHARAREDDLVRCRLLLAAWT
jgi:hypothetical protein